MTIDPTFAVSGAEWQIAPVEAPAEAGAAGSGFGKMLSGPPGLTQTEAAQAAQDLATGQASDPTAVVMAVERAQLVDAARQPDPHEGRRGRPDHLPDPGLT